jgi:meiotically up-regulated gene 157 (Mug157) protein
MLYQTLSVSLFLLGVVNSFGLSSEPIDSKRPAIKDRTFSSPTIDKIIQELKPLLKDPELAGLFENCLPNTLDTTVEHFDESIPDSFVITGDIDALWLRDSSNQVIPYIPYVATDDALDVLLRGLIKRHAQSVLIDPFANAFQYNNATPGEHANDDRIPAMQNAVFEGKYEVDSLGSFMKLSYWYWRYASSAGRAAAFDLEWVSAVTVAVQTIERMQAEEISTEPPSYSFRRRTSEALDTLIMDGRGPPGKLQCSTTLPSS